MFKGKHGVFVNDPMLTTMEAWSKAQRLKMKGVYNQAKNNYTFTVPMGRRVGYSGGMNGDFSDLNSVFMVVSPDGKLITAFPTR